MFERLDRAESYPLVLPNSSKIVTCRTADVPLTKGVKSPGYSLYEVTDHGQPGETELNSTPTVVFEYGYTFETSYPFIGQRIEVGDAMSTLQDVPLPWQSNHL